MRKISFAFLAILSTPLFAQLNDDNYTSQELVAKKPEVAKVEGPFSISTSFEGTGKADFKHERCRRRLDDVEFFLAEVDASMIFYYNPCYKEGLIGTVGYAYNKIKWDNPYFDQNDFNTVTLALGGFTHRLPCWKWQFQIQANADLGHFNFHDNLYWNFILAGRYAYTEDFGLHFGVIALTGMRIDRFYPIIGFDWRINETWKLNLIFPLNMSLLYYFTPEWSVGIAGRGFDQRHRIHKAKEERWKDGLVEYRAAGVELGINYTSSNEQWVGNLHIGELLGGRVKSSNKKHHHIRRHRFESAPYVGGELAVRF